jgi:uncharacterized protein YjbI with pentapeptide repeats
MKGTDLSKAKLKDAQFSKGYLQGMDVLGIYEILAIPN